MFPRSDAREFGGVGGSTPMVLEESKVDDDDSGVDDSEIQHCSVYFECHFYHQHCLQVQLWKMREVFLSTIIQLAGDEICDVNANFYRWNTQI